MALFLGSDNVDLFAGLPVTSTSTNATINAPKNVSLQNNNVTPTITNLPTLRINYLTAEQYQDAVDNNLINENELYLTPASEKGSKVTIEQTLLTGTASATIFIDGTPYIIYAPTPVQADWNQTNTTNLSYIQNKPTIPKIYFDTTSNWNAQAQLISEANAIYIYTDAYQSNSTNIPCIKIGDGLAYLIDMPFISKLEIDHRNNTDIHITSAERTFWNNKVSVYYNNTNSAEELVFYTNQRSS